MMAAMGSAESALQFVADELRKGQLLRPLCQPGGDFERCRVQLRALAACPNPKVARLEKVGSGGGGRLRQVRRGGPGSPHIREWRTEPPTHKPQA